MDIIGEVIWPPYPAILNTLLLMEAIKKFWSETMEIPEARWIIAIAGLVIVSIIAYYIVKLFRDMALGAAREPVSYISDFQRLRDEGKVDDEEYARLTRAIPKDDDSELVFKPDDPGDESKKSE